MKGIPGNVSDPLAFYADPDPVKILNAEPDPARGKIFNIFYRYSVGIKFQGPGTATNKFSNYSVVLYPSLCLFLLSPLTRLENIGSVYPIYVYNGNRPFAPILRQRRCSLMYDVY
jgi:hypothetical protein